MFEFDPVTKPSQKPDDSKLKNSASDAKKPSSLKLSNNRSWDDGRTKVDDDNGMSESGVCSPPLWKTTSSTTTTSPPRSPPQYYRTNYRALSPTSRAQAIARGQRELMEMVRNLPESCYELSLKDLVEHPLVLARHVVEPTTAPSPPPEAEEEEKKIVYRRDRSGKVKKTAQGRINGEMGNGGYYLKMGFPIFLGSIKNKNKNKNKKKKKKVKNSSESDASGKGSEKEWWKKRGSSASDRSESCGSSVNGGSLKSSSSRSSSTTSRRSSASRGCWTCISRKVENP